MGAKRSIGSKTMSIAGRTLRSTESKTPDHPTAQPRKPRRHIDALDSDEFDARLDAAHARIDGVLRRLG